MQSLFKFLKRHSGVVSIILGLIVIPASLMLPLMVGSRLLEALKLDRYVPVEARVLEFHTRHESRKNGGYDLVPVVSYSYAWQGRTYESSRISLALSRSDYWRWTQDLKHAKDKLEPITAWLDPKDPESVLLDRYGRFVPTLLMGTVLTLLFPAIVLSVAWGVWIKPALAPPAGSTRLISDGRLQEELGGVIYGLVCVVVFAALGYEMHEGFDGHWLPLMGNSAMVMFGVGAMIYFGKRLLLRLRQGPIRLQITDAPPRWQHPHEIRFDSPKANLLPAPDATPPTCKIRLTMRAGTFHWTSELPLRWVPAPDAAQGGHWHTTLVWPDVVPQPAKATQPAPADTRIAQLAIQLILPGARGSHNFRIYP